MDNYIFKLAEKETFRKFLNIKIIEIKEGYAKVTMTVKENMLNIYGGTHGGAIFSLIDEAFELACNSKGKVAVGLNVNVSYFKPTSCGDILTAVAKEVTETSKTATFEITVYNQHKA